MHSTNTVQTTTFKLKTNIKAGTMYFNNEDGVDQEMRQDNSFDNEQT